MISHKFNCILIHCPRTGGTSLEVAIDGHDWWVKKGKQKEKHLTAKEARGKYAKFWDRYLKVSIVRNPYERAVSWYKWQKRSGNIEPTTPFTEWVKDKVSYLSGRFLLTSFINLPLDMILRFENFENDYDRLRKRLGLKKRLTKELPSYKKKQWQDYYTETAADLIMKYSRRDIELYGYTAAKWHPFKKEYKKEFEQDIPVLEIEPVEIKPIQVTPIDIKPIEITPIEIMIPQVVIE